MTLRQCQPNPARTRRHLFRLGHHSDDDERAPREGLHADPYSFAFVAGQGCGHLTYDLGIPRDIC